MLLIRYQFDDNAAKGFACGRCGRMGMLVKRIMGRQRNMFKLKGDRLTWPAIPAGELHKPGIELFKFVQTDIDGVDQIRSAGAGKLMHYESLLA